MQPVHDLDKGYKDSSAFLVLLCYFRKIFQWYSNISKSFIVLFPMQLQLCSMSICNVLESSPVCLHFCPSSSKTFSKTTRIFLQIFDFFWSSTLIFDPVHLRSGHTFFYYSTGETASVNTYFTVFNFTDVQMRLQNIWIWRSISMVFPCDKMI